MIVVCTKRPIFSPIFTNDYYQACLIKSVIFPKRNLHFHDIFRLDITFLGLHTEINIH